jgi:regulator of protease activity HflC (stomatin/prohibitin superfamily)
MPFAVIALGIVIAVLIVAGSSRISQPGLKRATGLLALIVVLGALVVSSMRHINADEVGIVVKNIGTKSLEGGDYIAINGEQGIQADVLAPGWHFGYWPVLYEVREVPLVQVKANEVGLIETTDGNPLDPGQLFAPEYGPDEFQQMLDARYFLTDGNGRKGAQASVLTAGKYRLNTELYRVRMVPVTEVEQGEVAVLKANFGKPPTLAVRGRAGQDVIDESQLRLAGPGEMGVRADVLPPGKYPLNVDAFAVAELWTTQMIAHFTKAHAGTPTFNKATGQVQNVSTEEREITVRTSDGFTFPVDVRVEYVIEPRNAPIVVARLGDDEGDRFRNALNSAVRAIFRNNAEGVKALDYVQQRSHQESQSLQMLIDQMARFGVTITAVRIGDVGDEESLGNLLKTQTDRELAKQELITFQEQQKAAEEQKKLNKAKQESEEERRLATAAYAAKIAQETAKQKVTEAEGEAQAILVRARAQADAYQQIAQQIGKTNAAMLELLKIVGERNIQIAPRVMVIGDRGGSSGSNGETAALIGTMLDRFVTQEEDEPAAAKTAQKPE